MIEVEEVLRRHYGSGIFFEEPSISTWRVFGKPRVFINKTIGEDFTAFYDLSTGCVSIVDRYGKVDELHETGGVYRNYVISWDSAGTISLKKEIGLNTEELLKKVFGHVIFEGVYADKWRRLGNPFVLLKSHTTTQGYEVYREDGHGGMVIVDNGDVTHFEDTTVAIYRNVRIEV